MSSGAGQAPDAPPHGDEEQYEARRHDQLYASKRPASLHMRPDDWTKFDAIDDPQNAYHASVKALGPLEGRRVLDFGCGTGWLSVILAKRGGHVSGFDISRAAVHQAGERAGANGVTDATFAVASGYALPYRNGTFDVAIGQAILHHLSDKSLHAREQHRVLRPGGRAVFSEPLGNSLALERLRLMIPVESESPDDPDQWKQQFRSAEADAFRPFFDVSLEEFHFFSRIDRVIRVPAITKLAARLDRFLLRNVPPLRRYARAVVVDLHRRESSSAA